MNYRNDARAGLKRARAELETHDNHRVKYAALELRFAMEAVTYDRASGYSAEMPPKEYETWQPRKLMQVLLEIDPNADQDSSIAFGIEETPGVPAAVMQSLGSEKVFNLAALKKHYDAIGNFLHVPTLKQSAAAGAIDYKKLRERCVEVAAYLDEVLTSPVWNANFAQFAQSTCECGETIRKRMPHGTEKLTAECFACGATYTLTDVGNGQVHFQLDLFDVACGNSDCRHVIHILKKERTAGSSWTCRECGGTNTIGLAVLHTPRAAPAQVQSGDDQPVNGSEVGPTAESD